MAFEVIIIPKTPYFITNDNIRNFNFNISEILWNATLGS